MKDLDKSNDTSRAVDAPNSVEVDVIPHPELESWMFKRRHLPPFFSPDKERIERRRQQYWKVNSFLSRLAKYLHIVKWRWAGFRVCMGLFKAWFKIFNRLKIIGKENIPKDRAIFYVNHPGSLDVMLLEAVVGKPVSCFISWDNYWITGFGEQLYGFINKKFIRYDRSIKDKSLTGKYMIEKSVRQILQKNSMFAIWPSGGLSKDGRVKRGFSGVVKMYATLNAKQDIIPLVPVLLEGSGCYHIDKNPKLSPRTDKITVKVMKPFFLPREWLNNPDENPEGKTPREIIDYMMMKLAREHGQKYLAPNRGLIWTKKKFKERAAKMNKNKNQVAKS